MVVSVHLAVVGALRWRPRNVIGYATMPPTGPISPLDYAAAPLRPQPWYRLHLRGLLLVMGILAVVGSMVAVVMAAVLYNVMSTFPVPDPDPVPPPPTGPALADVLVFVGLGLIGVFGIGLIVASRIVRNALPIRVAAAE